jgi:hypothetical protein
MADVVSITAALEVSGLRLPLYQLLLMNWRRTNHHRAGCGAGSCIQPPWLWWQFKQVGNPAANKQGQPI